MSLRPKVTFAGLAFSAPDRGNGRYTVPVPALRKILNSGKVKVRCNYRYSDDYAADNDDNFGRGEVDPGTALGKLELGKPWLLYLDSRQREICFCPYQGLSYTITENAS